MKQAQLNAFSRSHAHHKKIAELEAIKALDLYAMFRASRYSTYGWFLKLHGITITPDRTAYVRDDAWTVNDKGVQYNAERIKCCLLWNGFKIT